jgi:hypothetical protein
VDAEEADVELVASAVADEVRFDAQPEVRVTFPGAGDRDSRQVTERTNIDGPVRPGVVHRQVSVSTRISSRLRDTGFEA